MMAKVAITGPSGCGKSTLAKQYKRVCSSDDYKAMGWSEASEHLSGLFDSPDHDTFEGTTIPRATRKWLDEHRDGRPFDHLIILTQPWREQTPGQVNQGKGILTVLREIEPELRARGVNVERR